MTVNHPRRGASNYLARPQASAKLRNEGTDMPLGLRLWLLLWIAGCAEQALLVPESDWQTVPPAQRAAIDRQYETELASARAELTAATASLAELPKTPPPPPTAPKPSTSAPASD